MTTTQYNLTLTVFFVSYAAFEALANFMLKRFKPSIFIPVTMSVVLEYQTVYLSIGGYSEGVQKANLADYVLGFSGASACFPWVS